MKIERALVAQGIEHRSPKAGVGRSNRLGGTQLHGGAPAPQFVDTSVSSPSWLSLTHARKPIAIALSRH